VQSNYETKEEKRLMIVQLNTQERNILRVSAINKIRHKAKVLDKCQRKMQLFSLSQGNTRKLMAACEQLSAEINDLCWSIGL
jgi:hypothetical protein